MKKDLCETLTDNLQNSSNDIFELRKILVEYKDMGINQTEMFEELSLLRDKLDGDKEEIILDLMDFVTGFCNPSLRIFK